MPLNSAAPGVGGVGKLEAINSLKSNKIKTPVADKNLCNSTMSSFVTRDDSKIVSAEVTHKVQPPVENNPSENYWHWKNKFALDVKDRTKIYRDYKKKGNSYIDLFSLTSDPDLFNKVN